MKPLGLSEIIKATGGFCPENKNLPITGISTDSRNIKPGNLFLALTGEFFDGHDFIETAVQRGAAAVIVSRKTAFAPEVPVITVKNTSQALLDLASLYRQKFSIPVIAVTGSVGKTSTKDMIASILSVKLKVHKSKGNFNNEIGLPLTIFQLNETDEAMVLEMGMRGLGEIRLLTNAAMPTIAVITNIGISHIERLGTQENILKAKLEIIEGFEKSGTLILNADDKLLKNAHIPGQHKVIYVGIDSEADYRAYDVINLGEAGVKFKIMLNNREYQVHIPVPGEHHVLNTLSGIACAIELGLTPEEIMSGIKNYQTGHMRGTILEIGGIKFINDCYNASPDSMKSALEMLHHMSKEKRSIAILGNIFELGKRASSAHYDIGRMCQKYQVTFSALIGENAADMARGIGSPDNYQIFNSPEAIVKFMKNYLIPGDVVLIKGSRGMHLEEILKLWEQGKNR